MKSTSRVLFGPKPPLQTKSCDGEAHLIWQIPKVDGNALPVPLYILDATDDMQSYMQCVVCNG